MDYQLLSEKIKGRMNCQQKALDLVCSNLFKRSELTFLSLWGLNYIDAPNLWACIGKTLSAISVSSLKLILGIETDILKPENISFNDIYAMHRNNKNIILHMDAFYCYWNQSYHLEHIPHFCNVDHIDLEAKIIYCSDNSVSGNKLFELALDEYLHGCWNVISFTASEAVTILNTEKIYSCLKKNYERDELSIIDTYNKFADRVLNITDSYEIFNSSDPNTCKIIILTKQISDIRFGIADTLLLISKDKNEFNQFTFNQSVYDSFYKMGSLWLQIKAIMVKMLISNNISKKYLDRLSNIIRELGHLENDTFNSLK